MTTPKYISEMAYRRNTQMCKDYREIIKERKEVERDILYASSSAIDGMPHATGVGNPTAEKAMALIERKAKLDEKIKAIEDALDMLRDDIERDVIRRNLFDKVPMDHINAPLSVSTMKRIRSEFVRRVAENMGEA